MIEAWGRLCQLMGVPRSTGQIYGLLYLSVNPLSLNDMVDLLQISKASVSNGTRQLASWGAIKQVWVQGDRRDYYEVVDDLLKLLTGSFRDMVKPRLDSSKRRLESMTDAVKTDYENGDLSKEEYRLCNRRIKDLSRLQKKIQRITPLAEKLL